MNALQHTLHTIVRDVAEQARSVRLAGLPTVFTLLPPSTQAWEDEAPPQGEVPVG
ncbi:MAG: hypothetical protein AAF624_12830 [Bacteroidota bacterium]